MKKGRAHRALPFVLHIRAAAVLKTRAARLRSGVETTEQAVCAPAFKNKGPTAACALVFKNMGQTAL